NDYADRAGRVRPYFDSHFKSRSSSTGFQIVLSIEHSNDSRRLRRASLAEWKSGNELARCHVWSCEGFRMPDALNLPDHALAVKLQPVDDLVDHLALGAHREPDQVELSADHGAHHLAVGDVMRGLEHVLSIDRGR